MKTLPEQPMNQFAINIAKVDCAIDSIVSTAYQNPNARRADSDELEKTTQLLLLSSLVLGESDYDDDFYSGSFEGC